MERIKRIVLKESEIKETSQRLLKGEIGILPTDTVYGIHCLADKEHLLNNVSSIKGRDVDMPFITLIADISDLEKYQVNSKDYSQDLISQFWPGPNTLIFNCLDNVSRSFRLPDNYFLLGLLKEIGPLISTSANPHGKEPAKNCNQAQEYFGDRVNFYVDGGILNNEPSRIYLVSGNNLNRVR
jgi:L-threonylcarbamoyladenylate synthase